MELSEVLTKRQSVRKYKEGDVPNTAIEEMVEAARLAPSGKNIQNWHFVVIKDQATKDKVATLIDVKNAEIAEKMAAVNEEKAARFRKFVKNFTLFFVNAPALTIVMSTRYTPSGYNEISLYDPADPELPELDSKRNPGMQSLGAALENFTLKAIDLGYGSCWLTSANYAYESIEKLVKEELGFTEDGWFFAALMSIGIPEDNPKSPAKKTRGELITWA
ncbi:MAG: nitroreductase family protein [Clostridiales Family XIII bacterium]|jgi:nitroreductase|nr:nitroreductase family protein [Clostridiales Family XIII bacterium]